MGCVASTSADARFSGAALTKDFNEQLDVTERQGTVDMRAVVKLIWEARNIDGDDAGKRDDFLELVTNLLASNVAEKNSFSKFYVMWCGASF